MSSDEAETGLTVRVPALLDGVRVDRAIAMVARPLRGAVAQLVTDGRVVVNGVVITTRSTPLAEGALSEVDLPEIGRRRLGPNPTSSLVSPSPTMSVIVVDKPAGLVVHPGAGHRGAPWRLACSLVSLTWRHWWRPDCAPPSALASCTDLIEARRVCWPWLARPEAYESLVAQLAARSVTRRYVGLVEGTVADDRGVVEAPIGRSARTPTRMAVSAQGREAMTGYTVLRRYDEPRPLTLVELALKTGRTHQIRVHMAAIGHSVVGDDRYSGPGVVISRTDPGVDGATLEPGRLFLHAFRLGFDHPGHRRAHDLYRTCARRPRPLRGRHHHPGRLRSQPAGMDRCGSA